MRKVKRTKFCSKLFQYLFVVTLAMVDLLFSAGDAETRFFQKHSTWYEKIPQNPRIMADSQNYVNYMMAPTGSARLVTGYREWSVPIWYARADTRPIKVDTGSNLKPVELGWNIIPIPPEALPAGNAASLEGKYRDGHMVIVSHDRRYAWDFFRAVKYPDGTWKAKIIRKWDLTGDGINQPYDRLGSCRVSPTPLLHGLITLDKVKSGHIDHAMAFATKSARKGSRGVYPAVGPNSGTSTDPWALQLGFRIQLDPTLDVNTLSLNPMGKMVARALQEYGGIFVINGDDKPGAGVYAESLEDKGEGWRGVIGSLAAIPFNKLRIVEPIYPSPSLSPPAQPSNLQISK